MLLLLLLLLLWLLRLSFVFVGSQHLLRRMEIELRIIEVNIRIDNPNEGFSLVQTILKSFHILRGRIPAAIRRLIIRAF